MKTLIKNVHLTEKYGLESSVNILIEDKYIKYVGKDEMAADKVIEGNGNLIVPGFYNAHSHAAMTLFRGFGDDLPLDVWLNTKVFPAEDYLTDEKVYWGSMLACAEMLRGGIVSFSDMYMFMDSVANAVNDTGMKANLARSIVSFDPDLDMKNDFRMNESIEFAKKWHGKNNGKILFCKLFLGLYQSNSHGEWAKKAKKMEPMIGIEPMTYSLRVNCSTD